MLWFYESFFPVLWIAFLIYWQIKAVDTKTTRRLEPRRLAHPARPHLPDRDHPALDNSHPAALALSSALADWALALLAGASVMVAGLLFAAWAREHLGSNWSRSVTIKQGHELITTGPYAVVRHPIYTGILAGLLGTAIALSQVGGFIGFVLIFLVLWLKLRMEEQWMRSQFGEAYATYARQTASALPLLIARAARFSEVRRIGKWRFTFSKQKGTLQLESVFEEPGCISAVAGRERFRSSERMTSKPEGDSTCPIASENRKDSSQYLTSPIMPFEPGPL